MKSAVIFGGGNIGRGFIGQIFYKAGYRVCFVDVNLELLNELNKEKRYPIRILDKNGPSEVWVEGVTGIDCNDLKAVSAAMENADICATAVGVNALKYVAKPIYEGIKKRFSRENAKPLDIIICENLIGADNYLKGLISSFMPGDEKTLLDKAGFVEASVGRMVPVQTDEMKDGNPLRICVERYDRLPVDKDAFVGEIPDVENLVLFSPFSFYIERKLFIHNMGHAATAYFGHYCGKEFIYESIGAPEIELFVHRAMNSAALALARKYNEDVLPLFGHVENLLYRFSNKQLRDTVARVGGDIKRKLSPNDRLLGALKLCRETGVDGTFIAAAIAASLLFEREGEEKMRPEDILTGISLLKPDSSDYSEIMSIYNLFAEGKPLAYILSEIKEKQNMQIII